MNMSTLFANGIETTIDFRQLRLQADVLAGARLLREAARLGQVARLKRRSRILPAGQAAAFEQVCKKCIRKRAVRNCYIGNSVYAFVDSNGCIFAENTP